MMHFTIVDTNVQGFLSKTGPSPKDVYKRRWCTLEGRKLMYHVDMLCAYAKVKSTPTLRHMYIHVKSSFLDYQYGPWSCKN